MQFQLPRETNIKLDTAIKERPDLVHTIFSEYAAASNGMDETNAKNTLVDILARHYQQLTKEN
jgi:hypothetical protein